MAGQVFLVCLRSNRRTAPPHLTICVNSAPIRLTQGINYLIHEMEGQVLTQKPQPLLIF